MDDLKTLVVLLLFSTIFYSCNQVPYLEEVKPKSSTSLTSNFIKAGDIVVTNSLQDSVILLDSEGNLKATLYDTISTTNNVYGIGWKGDTKEILITLDGNNDGAIAISVADGSTRTILANTNLSGTIRGITQVANGDIIVIESNNLERFSSSGERLTTTTSYGTWPKTNILTTPEMIRPTLAGGFLLCATGSDVIRTYDLSATQLASRASGIGGTTNAYGCDQMSNGNIVVSWQGTTDTVQILSSDLSSVIASYSDTSILPDPRGVAVTSNNHILILDATYEHIVELDSSANFVRIIGGGVQGDSLQLLVVPNY